MRCAGTIPGAGSRLQRASPMPEKMGRISPPRKRGDPCALLAQGSSTPSALYRNVLLLLCRRLLRSLLALLGLLLRLLGLLLLRLGLCGLGCGLGGLLGANAERDQRKSSEGRGHRTEHSSSWMPAGTPVRRPVSAMVQISPVPLTWEALVGLGSMR